MYQINYYSAAPVEEKADLIKAKHVMQQHQQKVIFPVATEEDKQRIHIRRNRLFADSLQAFSRPTFNVSKMLKVVFIGESAVDDGGPRREFFQLLLQEAFSKSGLFVGWPDHVIPIHHVEAVATNKFYIVGKMVATCLVQGGQPPVCLAGAVADYLIYEEVQSDHCIADIPDSGIRQKLEKVCVLHLYTMGVCTCMYVCTVNYVLYAHGRCTLELRRRRGWAFNIQFPALRM